ncbi:hypothetical protein FBZ98_1011364 [Rhizobium sp. ERR 922]|uniref:hypothetical protein n=1 Tax=unclassified Rhizobium TaxID=2613769 RepID=UPI0011A4ADF9|nr:MULTISPECIES: hypothetical protein [unclassified Rhizobium]TWB62015.1 hypothetical protein FBZ98_1011364 [Rhizobium sp. ERR 922]TWC04941.1 hypothetical protein FBZ97_1011364 [Rhizobium sp. ERR 942]
MDGNALGEDISKDPKEELQAKIAAANKRGQVLMSVWGVSLLVTIVAWALFRYQLQSAACYFRDNPFLRDLWPPNVTVLSEMPSLFYTERDQCIFFGVRSIASLTLFLGLAALLIWSAKGLRNYKLKKVSLTLPVLLVGFAVFFMWLDKFDNYNGRFAWIGFHPNDSVSAAIIKSLFRIHFYYFLLFFWVLSLIIYFLQKPAPSSPHPTDKGPLDL